jgi:hypothetical protein
MTETDFMAFGGAQGSPHDPPCIAYIDEETAMLVVCEDAPVADWLVVVERNGKQIHTLHARSYRQAILLGNYMLQHCNFRPTPPKG